MSSVRNYNFIISGLNSYMEHRPLYSPSEIKMIANFCKTVSVTRKAYIRNKVLEILENQSVGRFHTKLAGIILGATRERITIIGEEKIEVRDLGETFDRVREFFHEISETPPEFTQEALNDPIERKKILKYLSVKNRLVYYPIPLILYLFEHVLEEKVKLIFTRDLVGGEPAPEIGLPGGRDIDYFVVIEGDVTEEIKEYAKLVEAYLDNLFGSALINFMFKEAAIKGAPIEDHFKKPYNEIINHNIIEIHVINSTEANNYLYLSKSPSEGYELVDEVDGKEIYAKAKAPDARLYNMKKYRLRVIAAVEKALEELGIPPDESKTPEEFENRVRAMIATKMIKFGLIQVGWE